MSNRPYFYKQKPGKPGGHLFRKHNGEWQRKEIDGDRWKTLRVTKGEPPPPDPRRSQQRELEMSVNRWSWH